MDDPKWKNAPPEVWGPAFWSEYHEVLEKVPCGVCRPEAVSRGRAIHDLKNAELGKPIRFPKDLLALKRTVDKFVPSSGSCPRTTLSGCTGPRCHKS